MRVGSFWGLPAPMILLAMDDDESVIKQFSMLNTTMNRQILQDVEVEFAVLGQIEKIVKVFLKKPDFLCVSREYAGKLCVSEGRLIAVGEMTNAVDFEVLWQDLVSELTIDFAQKIIDFEARGSGVSLPEITKGSLRDIVESGLSGKSFGLEDTKNVILEIIKPYRAEKSNFTAQLLSEFQYTIGVPDVVAVNTQRFSVSPEMKKVLVWYAERLHRIKGLACSINAVTVQEEMIFDTPFFDLIKRKPESLIYMILNRFDYVKSKQTAYAIRAVCAEVRENVERYKVCLRKYVSGASSEEQCPTLDFFECVQSLVQNDVELSFLMQSERDGIFHKDDFSVEDLENILEIYRCVRKLNYSYFNSIFDLALEENQWDELSKNLCNVCICGLNNCSERLFLEAVRNISFALDVKVQKSQEFFEKINKIISDTESLISTIRPIGEVLQ